MGSLEEFLRIVREVNISPGYRPLSYIINEYAVRTGKSFLEGVFASPWSFQTLGIGKSVYALKLGMKIYKSWDVVKQHIVFMPQDFLAIFDRAIKDGRPVRLIIWDDAGVWIGRMRWLDKYVKTVKEFLNAIRTHCHHIVFTAPSSSEIVRGVRDQLNIFTFISSYSENPPQSKAVYVFKPDLDLYMKKRVGEVMEYLFIRHFEYYPEYEVMRRKYVEIGLTRMRTALEEVMKEIKGLTDYINDTYREISISEDDEDLDWLDEYIGRTRLGV